MSRVRVGAYVSTALTSLALLAIPVHYAFAQTAVPPASADSPPSTGSASSTPPAKATSASAKTVAALNASNAMADTAVSGELQTVEVVATTPLGAGTSTLDVPSETQTIDAKQIENLNQDVITQALARRTPGVDVTDELGSPLSQALNFRGQTASPVPGTPQGLAVYMNGVRINEAYGDTVNWAFIPTVAISNAQIVTGNPVFGLNALAGAVVMNMKNGFTYQGNEISLQGGSDYTVQGTAQYGIQKGDWAYYVAMEGVRTNGYRYFGQSDVERGYADVGYRAEGNEVHLSINGAATGIGAAGTTPLDLVNQDPWADFNLPGATQNQVGMITLSDQSAITSTLQFNGNAYFREYASAHQDGNISDFYSCGAPDACNNNDLPAVTPIAGLPDPLAGTGAPAGTPLGEIDSNWTHTYSTGTTLQLTDTDKIFGHTNNFTMGVSEDHGWTHFTGSSVLSTLPPDFVVPASNEFINQPAYDVSPVGLLTQNNYLGLFALDTFDITDRLSVHAGARFNDAQINLNDQLGTSLTSTNNFMRVNPVVGATFKITPDIAAYASYSEANRAPTPLELGCSNPSQPCMIDNFLVADPPLQQIVSHTVEAGFKGSNAIAWSFAPGRLDWSIAAYRTENDNDIMSVSSPTVPGFAYYTNAGTTLRQGVDLGATYTTEKWDAYANYSYISATFQSPVQLVSPNNPNANCGGAGSGIECVMPGDELPGVPHHKFKIGFDYEILPKWKVGADLVVQSSQYYTGDEINSLPQLPGFYSLNLRTSYQVNKDVQIYGLINNATNNRYYTYGALYDTGGTENQQTPGCPSSTGLFCSNDSRSVTISPPFEAFVGVKVSLNDAPPPAPALAAKY